jgi:multidrug resistance protein MdtO
MPFFMSKESKFLTTLTGVIGLIGLTIGIGVSLLLYKFTYGHPELRIPGMAIAIFLGMWLSRVFVLGPLGFLIGFVVTATQSVGEAVPSPELLVRGILWLWVAIAYGAGLTVVLNTLFLPNTPNESSHSPKPKDLFVSDAFTNAAHVHFALKVTLAAMFCYIVYMAIDWSGIHTALITCTFIALETTGATLHKGILRIGGCVIGGALALLTIVFLMPHMETIASLVVVVACASAIAGWVATGTELISYGGLQIAFAFFYSVFQGYAPDTDLDNVRNRVVGILFGLIVTGLVFLYIWPERTIDRFRDALRQALRQLARLLETPRPKTPLEKAKAQAHDLIPETSKTFEQARRYAELTTFEFEESPNRDRTSLGNLEETLSRAEDVFGVATSLVSDEALASWQQLPTTAQIAESDLRDAAAKRIERAAASDEREDAGANLSTAFARWTETMQALQVKNSRVALVSQIVTEVQ